MKAAFECAQEHRSHVARGTDTKRVMLVKSGVPLHKSWVRLERRGLTCSCTELCDAEVRHLCVKIIIEENVASLDVTVHVTVRVQVCETTRDLTGGAACYISRELGGWYRVRRSAVQQPVQRSTTHVLEYDAL